MWIVNDRGYKGCAIALPPASVDSEKFLTDYKWEGKYINHSLAGDFEMNVSSAYQVPNSWVIDAVNLTVVNDFFTNSFDQTLDAGSTHCCQNKSVATDERGTSVRRKVGDDGKLVDTNNSTNDFIPNAKPTLIENPDWK